MPHLESKQKIDGFSELPGSNKPENLSVEKMKEEAKEEMRALAMFLYSVYKNNPEAVKVVLHTEK